MKGLSRVAAVGGAALALAGSAFAANQITGRARPPAAANVTIASTAPLFQQDGLVPDQTFDRCTVLTNEGPQPADVTLFGTASTADLSPWLHLELVRGTLPPGGAAGDCSGFSADPADYGSGAPGVVFQGTLDTLPDASTGIADPTRWAVGEQHAYLLRVHYTGQNAQMGKTTVQSFNWGSTPFDDRPPEPVVVDPPGAGLISPTTPVTVKQCTLITFPNRSYIGARAITKPKAITKKKAKSKAKKTSLATSADSVIFAGEDASSVAPAEIARRQALLARTKKTASAGSPVMVVRLTAGKKGQIALRVSLRKNGKLTAPRRWRWVRVRLNAAPAKSRVVYPFTASAKMSQLRVGYNQIDITLNRGKSGQRIKGTKPLLRRSFAFRVKQPSKNTPGGTDCTLG
jgi:hypothetical protein